MSETNIQNNSRRSNEIRTKLYEKGVSKVKIKMVRNALNLNFTNTPLDYRTAYAQDRLNSH